MNIHEFTRLSFDEKIDILKTMAALIDQYIDNGSLIHNYQFNNFFVEATIDLDTEDIVEIIPFKRGFLLDRSYIMKQMPRSYNYYAYAKVA